MNMKEQARVKVALDIGSSSAKMMAVLNAEKPKLLNIGTKKVRGLSGEDITDAIKALAAELKVTAKDVNISVAGPAVTARLISMPRMSDEELKNAIRFEAEKFIPFNINDCIIDFQILKKDDANNKLTILLVAAKRDHVQERIAIVTQAGFAVSVVDVDSFAVINSFLRNYQGKNEEKALAILNVGASWTNLSILENGVTSFVRDVAIGGDSFNTAISKSMGIPAESTEEMKVSPNDKLADLKAAVRPAVNAILDEVKLSFSYYENQSGRNIDEIYVSGGSAAIVGLDELIQDAFELKPGYWNPLGFLDAGSSPVDAAALDKIKNSFAVCAGLVLR